MSEHDWHADPDIVVRTQMAISVYRNGDGDLVIRQEGQFHPSEDVWVVIAPHHVPSVISAMERQLALVSTGGAKTGRVAGEPVTLLAAE